MKKIIVMGDIFFHSLERLSKISLWVQKLFIPMIKDAIDENISITFDIVDKSGNYFSREHFFKLGEITNIKYGYQEYDIDKFNKQQIEYLKQYFDKDTIIIGFELYGKLSELLTTFGCTVIDFAYHPFKLFDDLTFGVSTNNMDIYNKLLKYKIPQQKFYYYTNYWKIFMEKQDMINDYDIENNSALFIGQTLIDKSVEKDGIFLNVTHFDDKLNELANRYSKIYYLPHPLLGKKRKEIYKWIKNKPYMKILDNRSTYGLLASEKIKKVVGISTSVLYEAQYFNKEVEYLYKPLFNVDVSFEEHSYISIIDDYLCPKFWADILSPVCQVKTNVENINYFKPCHNKVRNIEGLYWGYAQLDPIKRIPNFQESIKNLYKKYIAPHF